MDYKGRVILILGLGVSGKSALQFLVEQGAAVRGADKNVKTKTDILFADDDNKAMEDVDLIVKSPGISWEHPFLQQALEKGIEITSEIELGLKHLKNKKLIAITGSNGKTTTTLLTTHLLKHSGLNALAVGNVGTSLL